MSSLSRLEIDGVSATVDTVWGTTVGSEAHFTAMQVRGGSTRGVELHVHRLTAATKEMWGADLDGDLVRRHIRHALGGDVEDASVRVYVFGSPAGFGPSAVPSIAVTVKPAGGLLAERERLRAVQYQRPDAHLKRLGNTGQSAAQELAQRNGFQGALLVTPDLVVSETAIANIGFFDGDAVVWPDGPMLHGITMQLLERALADRGVPVRRATVRVRDIASFNGAFVSNARGIAPVTGVDDVDLPVDAGRLAMLRETYDSVAWEPL
jgi:branched-subunit amino acid aminotransferase/4-amino-4-deoxychorismate lyase